MRPPTQRRSIPYFGDKVGGGGDYSSNSSSSSNLQYEGGPSASFADIAPLMMASTASLADAQEHIKKAQKEGIVEWDIKREVTMDRWRPNWVLDGAYTC